MSLGAHTTLLFALGVQAETGAAFIPPYNHPDVISGQGTIALEFLQQVNKRNGSMKWVSIQHVPPSAHPFIHAAEQAHP